MQGHGCCSRRAQIRILLIAATPHCCLDGSHSADGAVGADASIPFKGLDALQLAEKEAPHMSELISKCIATQKRSTAAPTPATVTVAASASVWWFYGALSRLESEELLAAVLKVI